MDRETIQSWITTHIEEEYQNSIMKKMILPMFANSRGKKLRPLIATYVFRMINGEKSDDDRLKALCASIEISHNASLIVDDIFDKDTMRRGEETFYVKFGTFAALSGAYNLSAFVFDLATRTNNSRVVREIGKVGTALSSALFMSNDLVSRNIVTKPHFMDILFRKTTALFQASAKCSSILTTDDEDIIEKIAMFGKYFGDAYQLRDDVLGIVGTLEDLGKLPISDIENRFQSLITIYAMEDANASDLDVLKSYYLKGVKTDIDIIRSILVRSGAIQKVMDETLEIKKIAMDILLSFDESPSRFKLIQLLNKINFDTVSL